MLRQNISYVTTANTILFEVRTATCIYSVVQEFSKIFCTIYDIFAFK